MNDTELIDDHEPAECDRDIYENGKLVAIAHGANPAVIELFVKSVAEHSKQPVDWYYAGGRAAIKTTGDVKIVKASLEHLRLYMRIYEDE